MDGMGSEDLVAVLASYARLKCLKERYHVSQDPMVASEFRSGAAVVVRDSEDEPWRKGGMCGGGPAPFAVSGRRA